MGTIDLSEIVNDADLAESYTVSRSTGGTFVAGGWQDTKTVLQCYGVVSVATAEDLEMVPEGDRVTGMMAFWASVQLFETHVSGTPGISDVITWEGFEYRIITVRNYSNRGYWKVLAARLLGA